jgi:hypothetical protein
VTDLAPALAIASTVARSCSGESVRHGRIGAISTEQPRPASASVRTASRRRAGLGVPGSTVRQTRSSTKPIDMLSATSTSSAARRSSGRSRSISVPLVRIENGVPDSASAEMMPGISR